RLLDGVHRGERGAHLDRALAPRPVHHAAVDEPEGVHAPQVRGGARLERDGHGAAGFVALGQVLPGCVGLVDVRVRVDHRAWHDAPPWVGLSGNTWCEPVARTRYSGSVRTAMRFGTTRLRSADPTPHSGACQWVSNTSW